MKQYVLNCLIEVHPVFFVGLLHINRGHALHSNVLSNMCIFVSNFFMLLHLRHYINCNRQLCAPSSEYQLGH